MRGAYIGYTPKAKCSPKPEVEEKVADFHFALTRTMKTDLDHIRNLTGTPTAVFVREAVEKAITQLVNAGELA